MEVEEGRKIYEEQTEYSEDISYRDPYSTQAPLLSTTGTGISICLL